MSFKRGADPDMVRVRQAAKAAAQRGDLKPGTQYRVRLTHDATCPYLATDDLISCACGMQVSFEPIEDRREIPI
jgi:hypothetical protein